MELRLRDPAGITQPQRTIILPGSVDFIFHRTWLEMRRDLSETNLSMNLSYLVRPRLAATSEERNIADPP